MTRTRRALRAIARLTLVTILLLAAGAGAAYVWLDRAILSTLPSDLSGLQDWRPLTTCHVYDAAGAQVDDFYLERRVWVSINALPGYLGQAFVAAEDRRFFSHKGVDPEGILRALVINFQTGETRQGGSTITQQLVKNLLVGDERSYTRKLKEAALAIRLERELDKHELLELYLNYVALGSGNYGVEAAARDYFGIGAAELDPGQAALLAGLVPAPSRYSPRSSPELARERRRLTLRAMVQSGYLGATEASDYLDDPVLIPHEGQAAGQGAAYLTEVRREIRRLFGGRVPFELGLRIHTPYDSSLQALAEQAVRSALEAHEARRRAVDPTRPDAGRPLADGAAVVLENATGRVLALTGGYETDLEGFVRGTQARRQPGSSFKPYVYGAALAAGRSQVDVVVDAPISLPAGGGKTWSPRNYGGAYMGALPLRRALAMSLNTVAVRLAMEVGADEVARFAAAAGVRTPVRADLTAALGSSEVTPMDQALGYATIARLGVTADPVYIDRLMDAEGAPLGIAGQPISRGGALYATLPGGDGRRVMAAGVARELADMLREVVRAGTGWSADRPDRFRAGKTGTTNGFADAWFVGFTPRHTIAVWIGDDKTGSLGDGETGGGAALPAWAAIADALDAGGDALPLPADAAWRGWQGQRVVISRRARLPAPVGRAPLGPFGR